jgi:hypothetical protein
MRTMKKSFIMTVDVDPPPPSASNLDIKRGTTDILRLFQECRILATFFVAHATHSGSKSALASNDLSMLLGTQLNKASLLVSTEALFMQLNLLKRALDRMEIRKLLISL